MDEKVSPARGSSSEKADSGKARRCKYNPCAGLFFPKRKDHVFCSPSCKTKHTMAAYEAGLKVIEGKKGMHARSMKSPQMQVLYAALIGGEPKTTRELHIATGLEAVGTAISELRRCGYAITCKFKGRTNNGAKVYEYTMEGAI